MPTCNHCETEISQDRVDNFSGLCPFCYLRQIQKQTPRVKKFSGQNKVGFVERARRRVELNKQKEIYCKKCKKDVVPVRESYSPKHTLGWLLEDPTMTRGLRCPYCKKKLYSKSQNIIMISMCIIFVIIVSLSIFFGRL